MKVISGLLVVALFSLLITGGCMSGENNQSSVPGAYNTASPVVSGQIPTVSPVTTTLQENYTDQIIGAWKTEVNDSQVIYWQFNNNGTLTGGSKPGDYSITGNWSLIGFRNLFAIKAVGTNDTGVNTTYNVVIYYDLTGKNISVVTPREDTNWTFTRQ